MPLSRDSRFDRRRRVLREGQLKVTDAPEETQPRARRSRGTKQELDENIPPPAKRSAGYSQSVRKACQHRLVQFIPVRKRSLIAAIVASIALPALLLSIHHGIFISEWLPWKNHPIAAVLDASHPRSLAAWLGSQLWLLCLAATLLTFQLRKHKLDDYDGEYRLWFWLVLTCTIGSIDSTTRVSELFGAALDRWSQLHVGWSGGAIVQATLATLVGLLGLRLCSELKAVPASLVLWLLGLVCWAGSAALAQSLFKIDLSYQNRIWLRASLWLVGLTSIWVAALFYLRSVYIEAQRRFILRGRLLSAESVSLRERLVRAWPKGKHTGLQPSDSNSLDPDSEAIEYAKIPPNARGKSIFSVFRKAPHQADAPPSDVRDVGQAHIGSETSAARPTGTLPSATGATPIRNKPAETRLSKDDPQSADVNPGRKWFRFSKPSQGEGSQKRTLRERFSWSRKAAQPTPNPNQTETPKPKINRPVQLNTVQSNDPAQSAVASRKPEPAKSKVTGKRRLRIPSIRLPKFWFPKLRLPKLKLPSLRLPPPEFGKDAAKKPADSLGLRPAANSTRQLPGTDPSDNRSQPDSASTADNYGRSMSKAERKKLRRLGRDDETERRAA